MLQSGSRISSRGGGGGVLGHQASLRYPLSLPFPAEFFKSNLKLCILEAFSFIHVKRSTCSIMLVKITRILARVISYIKAILVSKKIKCISYKMLNIHVL